MRVPVNIIRDQGLAWDAPLWQGDTVDVCLTYQLRGYGPPEAEPLLALLCGVDGGDWGPSLCGCVFCQAAPDDRPKADICAVCGRADHGASICVHAYNSPPPSWATATRPSLHATLPYRSSATAGRW